MVCEVAVFISMAAAAQTEREADNGANFLKYHVLGEKTFTVKADRDTPAGMQLFEDYGDNDNAL